MKYRKITAFLLAILVTASIFILPSASASAKVKTVNKTVYLYNGNYFPLIEGGNENLEYGCSVSHKEYIKVDFRGYGGYDIYVKGKKLTKSVKPVITVFRKNSAGKKVTVKKYRITVKPPRKVKYKDIVVGKGCKKLTDIDEWAYTKKLKLTLSNSSVASVKKGEIRSNMLYYSRFIDETRYGYCVKGKNYGRTKVTVSLKGTNVTLGSFYVTVKDIKPSIKKKYKSVTLRYNSHGEVEKSGMYLLTVIKNKRENAVYSAKIRGKGIAKTEKTLYGSSGEEEPGIVSGKVGKTVVDVYEKRSGFKTKVGSFNIKVKQAKMADVMLKNIYRFEVDDIYLMKGEKFDFRDYIKIKFINGYGGSKFKKSEYKMTFKSDNPDFLSVSKKGIVKCLAEFDGSIGLHCTVTFSDGSKQSYGNVVCFANDYGVRYL